MGSSHFRLAGRMAARGAAFSPRPNCTVSLQVSRANPWALHPASFVPLSCARIAEPPHASRKRATQVLAVRTSAGEAIRGVIRGLHLRTKPGSPHSHNCRTQRDLPAGPAPVLVDRL